MGASLFALASVLAAPAIAEPLKVFAAASLTDALDAALLACSETPGTGIYAGSGTIARQIDQGAPADLYISANPQWMDWLEKRGMVASDTRVDLLGNELVVISSSGANHSLLGGNGEATLAIADMQTVPAGIYARQALTAMGYPFEAPTHRIVQGGSVREVLNWVLQDEVDLGIVYRSDTAGRESLGSVTPFPPAAKHDPIRYPAAVISDRDTPNARRLLACLQGEEASEVFADFGFTLLR